MKSSSRQQKLAVTEDPRTSLMRRLANMEAEDEKKSLFEGFRSEARNRASAAKYDRAAELYAKALDLFPDDEECLVARATSLFHCGQFDACIQDACKALEANPNIPKAYFMKGEALYHKGEFEEALICYHRANKIRPGAKQYTRGIQKTEAAIINSIGEAFRDGPWVTSRSAQSKTTPRVELLAKQQSPRKMQLTTKDPQNKKSKRVHAPKTVKKLLEELYGDWKFLEKLLNEENSILESIQNEVIKEESQRLKKKKAKKGILKTSEELGPKTEEDDDEEGEEGGLDSLVVMDSVARERRKARMKSCEEVKGLVERELTYLEDRTTFWIQQKTPSAGMQSSRSRYSVDLSQVMETINRVQRAQANGQFLETLQPAERTLNQLCRCQEGEVPDRLQLMGTLHSLAGTAYCETGNLERALHHHQYDLNLAERDSNLESKSRALDNLARVYIRSERFNSAVRCLKKKVPLVEEDLEATWLYHELGQCYLHLENYSKSQECAQKSLAAAKVTGDCAWQLNAWVLLAQSKVEQCNYEGAQDDFEEALKLANEEGDEDASLAIKRALSNVREKIKQMEQELELEYGDDNSEDEEFRHEVAEDDESIKAHLKVAFSQSDPNSEEDEREGYEEDWDQEEEEAQEAEADEEHEDYGEGQADDDNEEEEQEQEEEREDGGRVEDNDHTRSDDTEGSKPSVSQNSEDRVSNTGEDSKDGMVEDGDGQADEERSGGHESEEGEAKDELDQEGNDEAKVLVGVVGEDGAASEEGVKTQLGADALSTETQPASNESESIADLQERPESFRGDSRPESTPTMSRRPMSSLSRSSRPRSTLPHTYLPQY